MPTLILLINILNLITLTHIIHKNYNHTGNHTNKNNTNNNTALFSVELIQSLITSPSIFDDPFPLSRKRLIMILDEFVNDGKLCRVDGTTDDGITMNNKYGLLSSERREV